MTNDLSTLSGALLEMKDQLIYELGEKGVTASYDSTTGLLGLIGKISEIEQGGGSCYKIEFSEDSYTAVGGSATLEIYLQENYQPKSGATVTVTGSDYSLYSGITNSNGVASVTVSGLSATATFTASYSNVSDTCIVNVSTHLFAPALDGTDPFYQITGTTTIANGEMSGGAGYLTTGWDNTVDWKLTFDGKVTKNDGEAFTLHIPNTTQRDKNCIKIMCPTYNSVYYYNNNGSGSSNGSFPSYSTNTWYTFIVRKTGTTMTITVNNNTSNSISYNLSSASIVCLGVDTWGGSASIKNVTVDPL